MDRYNPLSDAKTFEERKEQSLNHCDNLTKDFANRADRHKYRFRRLQITSIVLAVCTTVLSFIS